MEALFYKAHPTMNRQKAQLKCADLWQQVKADDEAYEKAIEKKRFFRLPQKY